jgi:hypothetical protein
MTRSNPFSSEEKKESTGDESRDAGDVDYKRQMRLTSRDEERMRGTLTETEFLLAAAADREGGGRKLFSI